MSNKGTNIPAALSTMIAYMVTIALILFAFIIIFAIVMVLFARTLVK